MFTPCDFLRVRLKRDFPELIEPRADRRKSVRVDAIDPARPLGTVGHEVSRLQGSKVLRNGRP